MRDAFSSLRVVVVMSVVATLPVFALIDASTEDTVAKAEALRAATKALKLSHRGRSLGDLSISAGVAEFPDHGTEAEDLMKAADEALYRAKQEGRDRVVVTGT